MQATMVVADAKESLTITGNGDVVEPHDGVVGEPSIPVRSQLSQAPSLAVACSLVCFVHTDDRKASI